MSPPAATISLPVIRTKSANAVGDDDSHERIAQDLKRIIRGDVRFELHDRMLYSTDASIYQVEPIGVICPKDVDDVRHAVEYCATHGLPILPRGGGTSLAGQTVNRAVVIDFSVYLRNVIEIDTARRIARVQPGVTLDQFNAVAAPHGLIFGPDVASSWGANVGGMIGNNSAGARSILYGRTVEHVLGLNVLLMDGTQLALNHGAAVRDDRIADITQRIANIIHPRESLIEQRFPKTVRRVNGYNLDLILAQLRDSTPGTFDRVNLSHLICGSEGTLAVTTEATLNLVPLPKRTGLAIVAFASIDAALRALTTVLRTNPSAVEMVDDVVIGVAMRNVEYRRYVDLLPQPPDAACGAVLYVEYFADDEQQLQSKFDDLQSSVPACAIHRYTDAGAMTQAWKLRKAGEPLLHNIPGPRKPITFIEDLAVDPTRLADFVTEFRAMVARHGTTAAYYAHASVGCLHIRPLVSPRDPNDVHIMRAIAEEATDLVVRYGGALSGEHGDGRVRSHLLERYYGREICDAFRAIKAIFDPRGLLNPGNIVDPPHDAMTEHLRVHPLQHTIEIPPVATYFRYENEHGLGEAVEMCNGAGVCRKMKTGTMCPSYRATLDERHATRGRGNALRLAITGQFSSDGASPRWNDPETLKTLDLCLSCKACKTECPSNVDIAKLKAEYLAQSFAASGKVPLRTRAFGNIRLLNQIGAAIYPLANAMARIAPAQSIIKRMLGIHPKRSLPRFDQSLFTWMSKRQMSASHREQDRPTLVLFPDCFTTYNEPHIGRAAVTVLERLGYRIVLPRVGCCGRAMISNGLLPHAQKVCNATACELLKCMERERAVAVVGCEPSCISAIKDDWLNLRMDVDHDALKTLASRTYLVEDFIDRHWNDHPKVHDWQTAAQRVGDRRYILHGHCHQKALWGIDSSANVLRRLLGSNVRVLDSGCCGMAGAFGYTRDHYDISMKIGEQSLFSQVRDEPEAVLIAPGTSCREQLRDGLNRKALHPIEVIADVGGLMRD